MDLKETIQRTPMTTNKKPNAELGCAKCGKTVWVYQDTNYNKELPKGWRSNLGFNNAYCEECSQPMTNNNLREKITDVICEIEFDPGSKPVVGGTPKKQVFLRWSAGKIADAILEKLVLDEEKAEKVISQRVEYHYQERQEDFMIGSPKQLAHAIATAPDLWRVKE